MSWTQDQARALADKILAMCKAPACEVSLSPADARPYAVCRQ